MESINTIVQALNDLLWGGPLIILMLGTHVFLTIRLKFPQRKLLTAIRLSFQKDKDSTGDVSQFSALATSLAATIGTGNIIGVATAVTLGGPGAVLWCWMAGIFAVATKYSEGLLAIRYRQKTSDGKMLGGPMYALEKGMGQKWLGVLFSLFAALAAFGLGNTVQANAISENLVHVCSGWVDAYTVKMITGAILAVLVGAVTFGGVKSIARCCTAIVPAMALLYVLGCLYILLVQIDTLPAAIQLIFQEAFSLKAAGGGTAGTVLMLAARYGIARGLFSNESGMGSAPIVAAAAQTRNPVRQALVSSTATFWDTVVVCALTGLVLITSLIANPDVTMSDGALLTKEAFGAIPYIGTPLLTFGIITFAFSTILGWAYYGERAIEYLAGKRVIRYYRIVFVALVFVGSLLSLNLVWSLADVMNALMSIPNLISLIFLSGVIARDTQHYLWDDHLDEDMEV